MRKLHALQMLPVLFFFLPTFMNSQPNIFPNEGRVGIGTVTPSSNLEVNGSTIFNLDTEDSQFLINYYGRQGLKMLWNGNTEINGRLELHNDLILPNFRFSRGEGLRIGDGNATGSGLFAFISSSGTAVFRQLIIGTSSSSQYTLPESTGSLGQVLQATDNHEVIWADIDNQCIDQQTAVIVAAHLEHLTEIAKALIASQDQNYVDYIISESDTLALKSIINKVEIVRTVSTHDFERCIDQQTAVIVAAHLEHLTEIAKALIASQDQNYVNYIISKSDTTVLQSISSAVKNALRSMN